MQELNIEKYVEANILTKKGTWYSFNGESIGQRKIATENLQSLIKESKVKLIEGIIEPTGLEPVKPNKNLENKQELPKQIEDIFKPLAASIGDIQARKKGGRFRTYIFGVDSRKDKDPSVMKCPYVFRHNDKKRNVRNGNVTYNDGWTVLSKKLIEIDPRTGKKWLEVARDDTPDEDMYSVGNYVLCYADKQQFKNKKGKLNMEDILKTASVTDARQENAEQMALKSKTDPVGSLSGYMSDNKVSQNIAKETLEKNENYTSSEAQTYIDNLNSVGSKDIDEDVARMKKLADSGKIGKTVRTSSPLKISDV